MKSDRIFKIWEYQVSHGQLLIRSPQAPASNTSPERVTNLDLIFLGVEYMAVRGLFQGIELVAATPSEVNDISILLGRPIEAGKIQIIASEGKRFPIVAAFFKMVENDWDIFESPFEFRSQFREK